MLEVQLGQVKQAAHDRLLDRQVVVRQGDNDFRHFGHSVMGDIAELVNQQMSFPAEGGFGMDQLVPHIMPLDFTIPHMSVAQ